MLSSKAAHGAKVKFGPGASCAVAAERALGVPETLPPSSCGGMRGWVAP